MSKDISLKTLNFIPFLKKFYSKYGKHAVFGCVILVLLIYVLVVLKINTLASAEPSADQEQVVTTSIPKIDANAVKQIQSLENSNTQVHSLFQQARNNPFQE
jgi:predicted PurR-regulated permease PerM